MLLLSIGVWCIVVYSFRVAMFGNPLANLLLRKDHEVLKRAEEGALSGRGAMAEEDLHLLRRFSRLTLLELVVFLLEAGILVYLLLTHTLFWVSLVLLVKDVLAMVLSVVCTKRVTREGGMLTAFRKLPGWLHTADRASAAISAVGFLYIFLAVNNIIESGGAGG